MSRKKEEEREKLVLTKIDFSAKMYKFSDCIHLSQKIMLRLGILAYMAIIVGSTRENRSLDSNKSPSGFYVKSDQILFHF